ncbi:hypothetical protein EPO34_03885 [Patescibacteria group bacterium]|nr:MAG: hypothetical protein EPO34_03885 [Patescibacteria group bacterium]
MGSQSILVAILAKKYQSMWVTRTVRSKPSSYAHLFHDTSTGYPHLLYFETLMRFYVLGSNPALSLAEFFAIYPSAKAVATSETVLVCDESGPSPKEAINRLAGVVKAGSVIASEAKQSRSPASDEIASSVASLLPRNDDGKKMTFGLSLYDGGNAPLFGNLKGEASKIGMTVKRTLEAEGRKVRVVTMKGDTLSSVAVTTQAKAGDIVLVATKDGILVGRTEAVQDFEAWSKRDFGRPSRDAKSGMLPPKLARTLVNLATGTGADLTHALSSERRGVASLVLLDPFCGSGTVPMEAMLMGFKAVIASDISKKATADTGRNLEWVRKEFPEARASRVSVYVCDAADLAAILKDPVDAVAGETYLGPPMTGRETLETIQKNMAVLGQSYAKMLVGVHAVMKPGARAAIAFPAFVRGTQKLRLPLNTILAPIGFTIERTFLYERKGQKVAREIVVMRKA